MVEEVLSLEKRKKVDESEVTLEKEEKKNVEIDLVFVSCCRQIDRDLRTAVLHFGLRE